MEHTNTTPSSSNPSLNSEKRKRKKNFQTKNPTNNLQTTSSLTIEWNSYAKLQLYSSKLFLALRQVHDAAPKRVKETADRVLAATAKGRSRWSRAILMNRLKIKFMKKNNILKRGRNVMNTSSKRKANSSYSRLKFKGMPAVQRKGRVLGKLVPGCRKESLPVVLEEATDYIAALEMQVRAMSALAELLSASGSSSSSSSAHNQLSSIGTPPR